MNKLIIALIPAALLLSGCENMLKTMVYHHKLYPAAVQQMAQANAATNLCLAENKVNKGLAFAFSNTAAQYLDLTVSDSKYYKQEYDTAWNSMYANVGDIAGLTRFCSDLEANLPRMTSNLQERYANVAQDLKVGRAIENQQLMQTMSSFGAQASQPIKFSFPSVTYKNEQPTAQNYLVNTKSGLVQCRVTSTNYVFCI